MRIGRVTWLGLTAAVIGWAMLLGEVAMADFVNVQDPPVLPPTFHDDFMEIGKTLIFSGFGLALVGALQTGFGALNRFFEAVLVRSGQKTQASALPSASRELPPRGCGRSHAARRRPPLPDLRRRLGRGRDDRRQPPLPLDGRSSRLHLTIRTALASRRPPLLSEGRLLPRWTSLWLRGSHCREASRQQAIVESMRLRCCTQLASGEQIG